MRVRAEQLGSRKSRMLSCVCVCCFATRFRLLASRVPCLALFHYRFTSLHWGVFVCGGSVDSAPLHPATPGHLSPSRGGCSGNLQTAYGRHVCFALARPPGFRPWARLATGACIFLSVFFFLLLASTYGCTLFTLFLLGRGHSAAPRGLSASRWRPTGSHGLPAGWPLGKGVNWHPRARGKEYAAPTPPDRCRARRVQDVTPPPPPLPQQKPAALAPTATGRRRLLPGGATYGTAGSTGDLLRSGV